MTKAATTLLTLSLLLAGLPATLAQTPDPTKTAVAEGLRRQAAHKELQAKLQDAQAAQRRKDLPQAAKLYDAAWELVVYIGAGVDMEAEVTKSGLASVRLELAREAQKRGDLLEASREVQDLLRVDPHNLSGIEFQRQNEQLIASQKGMRPDKETLETLPAIAEDKAKAATLVRDAAVLFEMRKLDEASAKLKQARAMDPANQQIYYYWNLIQEARYLEAQNKRDVSSRHSMVEVEEAWFTLPKRDALPVPNSFARSTAVNTSQKRQAIFHKLDIIHLDNVKYEGLPLSEVINTLHDQVKQRDPDKVGMNFILSPFVDAGGGGGTGGATGAIDPATGLPAAPAAPPAEGQDIGAIQVKIASPLSDVRLADLLDIITEVADRPPGTFGIKYSVKDYGVVFSWKPRETPELMLRTFRVDPNTFVQGLESVAGYAFGTGTGTTSGGGGQGGGSSGGQQGGSQGGQSGGGLSGTTVPRVNLSGTSGQGGGGQGGGGGTSGSGVHGLTRTNDTAAVSSGVRAYFTTLGVDLSLPKAVFWNDRQGTLLIRATAQDLDIIEAAIQALNITPPQITIKAKFVEVSQNDTKALGFDWYLGNVLMNNNTIGLAGGTAPSYTGNSTTANPSGTFPGSSSAGTSIGNLASDGLVTSGLRNLVNAPAIGTISGILTDPQFRVVIRALEQRDGVDLLNESTVTTLSGRQTQIQIVDLITIVEQANVAAQGGNTTPTTGVGTTVNNSIPTVNYPTETLPFGPTLDVIPYVSADGFTVQMTILPTLTEFLGYDDPGKFVPQAQAVGGSSIGVPITAELPLPHFRVRQVSANVIIWDGQTVVLGGLITEDVTKVKDKVPFLGDLPLVGRFFRSESSQTKKKNLVIFVTPRIIDAAGNPYHTEDEMPFGPNGIPPQTPVAMASPAPMAPMAPPPPPPVIAPTPEAPAP